jgi:Mn-dependent DtxR family transcriptional regulator
VPEREAGPDAEGIEHHVGDATLERMENFIGSREARGDGP